MASNDKLSRWKSEPNVANRYFQRMRRSSSLGDIQYKNALEEQMRNHLQSLKDELAREKFHVAELKRKNISNVRLAREQEICEARATKKDLLFKLVVQKDEEIEGLKDHAKESTNRQLIELEELKNKEAQRLRKEFEYEKEQLINVLAGSFREEARIEIGTQFENAKRQMDTEYFMLVSENKKLKSDLQVVKDADANKAEEIHKIYKEYNKALSKVKRDASQDSKRQMGEIRELKRVNSELERKLEVESGSCLKLQMEKESLEDALAKLRLADSWEKRTHRSSVKGIGGIEIEAAHAISFAPKISSRPHNAPERVLQRKVLEMTSLVRRLDESNQNFAARNQELVNEIENIKNEREPFKQKAKRLGDKNMELVQSNKRKDERMVDQQQEILSLKDKLKTYDEIIARKNKEISKLKSKVQVQNETEINREENDALQSAMQEQLKIIYELRQQTVEKDRRISVLRERMQKMKSKRQHKVSSRMEENGRKSTSPDSLNGSSKEDDDFSTTSESLNDLFLDEFEVAFESNSMNQGSHKYRHLLMEKLELEKAYDKLQSQVGGQTDPGRMQLEIDALQSDLLVSQAQIHQLENQLEDTKKEQIEIQNSNNNNNLHDPQYDYIREERDRLRSANKVLHNQLISTESELLSKNIEITRISQDLFDVEEQRDLLEFRIAELEENTKEKLSEVQSLPVVDDEKMGFDQEEDDVECDTLSVRIALKELEINRQSILKKRERSAIEKALDLCEIREKDIRAFEAKEKEARKLLSDLECKYNNIKNELIQKEQQISQLTKEKCKSEERDLLSIEDIFKEDEKALEVDHENLKQINANQAKLLFKAQKDIMEIETANDVLKQQLEKYEKEKKTELSKYKYDIKLLEEKVSELEKVKKRLVKAEGLNMELQYKIENIKIEKYARDLVGNVVYSLPNSIAEEIKTLAEEKRTLLVELEELKNVSKEPILADIQDYTAPPQQDQCTQTEADQDEIPWHKYMSPRSERSLSRNDSGLTSRLQTDEGTQTPRIHQYDDLLERLEHEDYLKSAATQKENVNNGPLVTFNEKALASEASLDSDFCQLSSESLFHFADRIVKEATSEAKRTIKDELDTTTSTTLIAPSDSTISPCEIETDGGPGEMIDLFVRYLERKDGDGQSDRQPFPNDGDVSKQLDLPFPKSKKSTVCQEFSQDSLDINIEFDEQRIETSSVDENSRQILPAEKIESPEPFTTGVQCNDLCFSDFNFDKWVHGTPSYKDLETLLLDGGRKQLKERVKSESSQSVASEDVADLLAYGEMVKDDQILASQNVPQNQSEDVMLRPNEFTIIDYDESFAVETFNNTVESRDETLCEDKVHYAFDGRSDVDDMNARSEKGFSQFKFCESKQSNCKMLISERFLCPSKCETSFNESSLSFEMGFPENADNDFDGTRLNQTDDGSFRSHSTMDVFQPPQIFKNSSTQDETSCPIEKYQNRREKGNSSRLSPVHHRHQPKSQSKSLYRSRSLSPKRRKHNDGEFFRCFSVGREISNTEYNVSRKLPKRRRESKYAQRLSSTSCPPCPNAENATLFQSKGGKSPPVILPKPRIEKNKMGNQQTRKDGHFVISECQFENGTLKKELNWLRQECSSLERQIKNKDSIMRTMKAELKEEVENIALLEKKEKVIQEKSENNAQLTQELQRCQKELEAKNSEINKKDFEINQLKTEVKNLEISKKYTEQSYTEVQVQVNKLEVVEKKLADMQEEYDTVLLKNRELIDKIKYLEVAETDFIELERNVIELQEQLQDFENIEAHRDELLDKFQNLKRQRDEFLEKGRMVEEERNDFLRTNQTMEQRLEEFAKKYNTLKKNCGELNRTILILEREKKDLESKMLDSQNDRNIMQTALGKLETERDDLIREVKEVTSEKYMLEQKLTEMDEMLSDHDHLEEGFHSLRLKLGEITRQRDDAEMLIPSLKAKIALLKKACREKDETMTRYIEELKEYRHGLSTMSPTKKGRINENLQQQQQQTRNQSTSSYFTKNIRENTYTTKQNYDVSDESVVISEDDPSVMDEGSIDYRNDRRLHATNRRIRVYDRRGQPVKRRRIYRALTDYDPYKSSASHHPERELRLKEGDYVTVYGEMDIDGYLEAEIDGETGLVPSIYVEESNDEYSSQRTLGHSTREAVKRNNFGAYRRKFVCLYDYDPYKMGHGGGAEQQLNFRKGDVITVIGDIDIDGYYSAELHGRSGVVPSTFVRELGASRASDMSSYGAFNQGREQKSYEQHSRIITENRNNSAGRTGSIEILRDDVTGPPFPPTNLKVLRIVSDDSLILTWNMPPIDKSGCSNGALVTGYKIWVNGKPVQDVKKYLMTKALISGLNLRNHLEFDIQTVAENGFCSEKCHFDIAGADSLRNPVYEEFFIKAAGNYRTFIALFDYDPYKSSPNQNPSLELQFNEGDLLKVYDTSRSDGFYHAEVRGKKGLVPSNFIEEISMPESSIARRSEMYSTRSGSESYSRSIQNDRSYSQFSSQQQQKQQQQRLSTTESEKRSSLSSTFGGRRRKMVASYDYDPLKQSPSKDKSKELNLRKGQYVTVIGDMRPDGFYLGEIDGRQGFVPGDFLEPSKEDDMESRRVQFASANNSE